MFILYYMYVHIRGPAIVIRTSTLVQCCTVYYTVNKIRSRGPAQCALSVRDSVNKGCAQCIREHSIDSCICQLQRKHAAKSIHDLNLSMVQFCISSKYCIIE